MRPRGGTDRLPALDGLRGLAALVVLLSHMVEASVPALSEALNFGTEPNGVARWFMRTPLAIVWAGPELVIVFFVLSGFVLTRALRAHPATLGTFLSARVVRLYLPVWAALVPAALLLALVPRAPGAEIAGVHSWLNIYAQPVGLPQVATDMALVLPGHVGQPGWGTLDGVLWSLRWEVLFSLALPFLLRAERLLTRLTIPLLLALPLVVDRAGGRVALMFAPPFLLGVLLALHEAEVVGWRARIAGRGAPLAVVAAACLLGADLWLPGAERAQGPSGALVVAGAGLAVVLPLVYASVARPLLTAPMQWLGSRSFSLYLVHFPIVLAYAYGLHHPHLPVLAAVAVPTSLLAAELFHRVVERPCHRLARAAGARAAARERRPRSAEPVTA